MGRSIGAVVIGFLYVLACLWLVQWVLWLALPETGEAADDGTESVPQSRLLLTVACTFASAVVGGLMTAHLAGREPLAHGLALGAVLVTVLGIISLVIQTEPTPSWYQLALPAVSLPAALLGAWLRPRLRRPPLPPEKPA